MDKQNHKLADGKSRIATYLFASFILVASIATHAAYWGHPREVVFDETYFSKFAVAYQDHRYYFDIHPPLGKLLIGAAGQLGGVTPAEDFDITGQPHADNKYMSLRVLPILAGTLLPLVIFFLCLQLGFSAPAAFLAGISLVLENSLLVNSRFTLTDSFLLLFGFAGFLGYFLASKQARAGVRLSGFIASGLLLGMAASIKWTGITFLFLVLCVESWKFLTKERGFNSKNIGSAFLAFACVPFAVYYLTFAIHFSLLTVSGPGDAFMSPQFQKTLAGSMYDGQDIGIEEPISQWDKFLELNKVMYTANRDLTATHPYSSMWSSWPLMERPVYFWFKGDPAAPAAQGGNEWKIYLLGNPFVYWLSLPAVLMVCGSLIFEVHSRKKRQRPKFRNGVFLATGYFANFLPFALIHRPMFLYHYFVALIFGVMSLAWLIDHIRFPKARWAAWAGVLAVFAAAFIFFAPFTYGLPLDTQQQDQRFWFPSWR